MSMSPNVRVVVQQCVGDRGRDGRKIEPIRNGEGGRNEERTVSLVSLEIEGAILVDDSGEIVSVPCIVKRT
jgi:hypothetical protein